MTIEDTASVCSQTPSVIDRILKSDCAYVGAHAAGSAAALGTAGGVAGLSGGAAAGAAAGVVVAVFTFGLSIPIGTAIGGGIGLGVGASAGSAAGALGGVAFGLRRLRRKHEADQEEERELQYEEIYDDDDSCRATACSDLEFPLAADGKRFGDVLAVVGSDAVLGGWDESKALELVTSAKEYPRWSTGVAPPEGDSDVKLLILHPDGSINWEPIKCNQVSSADVSGEFTATTCDGKLDESQTVNDILAA